VAQRVVVQQFDDTDGSPAAETVRFGLDGASYEIDLSASHAEALREALARFIVAGRRDGRLSRPASQTTVATDADPTAVRAWARSNGVEVSPRGRIPAAVLTQFRDAGN
jgi:hypothetical protein